MNILSERFRRKKSIDSTNSVEHRYVRFPSLLLFLVFFTSITFASGSIYWIVSKDNELEKSRRVELELRNNIKERDYVIQQYRQQVKQLERRVEILDAIQELSANTTTQEDRVKIAKRIDETCEKFGHDPFLILALMYTESSIRPDITSPAGAKGLMQLMPSTGHSLTRQIQQSPKIIGASDKEEFDLPHYHNIEGNIELGTLYLTQLMLRYQNLEHAIYAYNLGPNIFEKRQKEGGPFPQKYLAKVMGQYAQLTANRHFDNSPVASSLYSSTNLNHLLALSQTIQP